MIRKFNRLQSLRAVGHFALCLIATALAFAFFLMAWFFIEDSFNLKLSRELNLLIPGCLVVLVYLLGWIDLVRHGGLRSYRDSALFLDFDLNSASGTVTDYYVSQATSSAYMISQVMLCAPIQLIKAMRCLKSMIKDSAQTEEQLKGLLERIRTNGKWHEASTYSEQFELLGHLINMDKVEFSARKGVVKAA